MYYCTYLTQKDYLTFKICGAMINYLLCEQKYIQIIQEWETGCGLKRLNELREFKNVYYVYRAFKREINKVKDKI